MSVTLYLGDCLEVMRSMPDKSVDAVITSPPYNKTGFREGKDGHPNIFKADMNYRTFSDNMDEKEYWDWQRKIFEESYRILKDTGSLFYNHIIRRYNGMAHHPIVELCDTQLKFYQQIIWDRIGSFNNNLTYLDLMTELILWFVKDKPTVNKNVSHRNEIWRIKPSCDKGHPATFPVALPKNCILLSTNPNDTILDPFAGSGTTGVACIQTNRNFIGIEIDPVYYALAEKRIHEAQQQPSLLEAK